MRFARASAVAVMIALLLPVYGVAQDANRKVAGGGITVAGWQGKVDPGAAHQGMSVSDSKFDKQGNDFHITTGPAALYWNPANTAQGDYTVKATFHEPKQTFSHPHPYGLFIGGSKLDADQPDALYCVAYRNGTYLVRMFSGGQVTTLAHEKNPAVKSGGPDADIVQNIAWNVKGDRAQCEINGAVVATYNKSDIVGPGKLESADGVVGIRMTHNTDVIVSNFALSK